MRNIRTYLSHLYPGFWRGTLLGLFCGLLCGGVRSLKLGNPLYLFDGIAFVGLSFALAGGVLSWLLSRRPSRKGDRLLLRPRRVAASFRDSRRGQKVLTSDKKPPRILPGIHPV